jgi:regulator of RNase E activity RraA
MEIIMPVGKRIFLKRNLPDKEIIDEFKNIPASNIADVMERNSSMNPRIKLVSNITNKVMAGPAFTVKVRAGDNLLIHAAMSYCSEGDVIVVSNEEDNTRSLVGEIMLTYLKNTKKISGIVLDGPIRDIDVLKDWDFPIYCTGTTPGGPYKDGPGEINVPISCGGLSVNPGDIIVGDGDGVIVIPLSDAKVILDKAKEFKVADQNKVIAVKEDKLDQSWVEQALKEKGIEIIDDLYKG